MRYFLMMALGAILYALSVQYVANSNLFAAFSLYGLLLVCLGLVLALCDGEDSSRELFKGDKP